MNEGLDEKLSSAAQEAVRGWVRALPEDTPSMAWRSALNERLLAEQQARRRHARFLWMARPVAALALAASFAMVFLMRPSPAPRPHPQANLGAVLVATHQESDSLSDLSGVGLNPTEAVTYATATPTGTWTESDVEGY